MAETEYRLGDMVDDYCTRCHLIMNHYVVSMVQGEIVKVRCQTCQHEQRFRHGKEGKKKKTTRQGLFDQVASSLPGFSLGSAGEGKSPPSPKRRTSP
jgi:hypothetical protein